MRVPESGPNEGSRERSHDVFQGFRRSEFSALPSGRVGHRGAANAPSQPELRRPSRLQCRHRTVVRPQK
eukprot:12024840-Alexandrium_andersonii.AAC.1